MIVSKVFPRAEISSSFIVDGENGRTACVERGRRSVTSKDENTKKMTDMNRRKRHWTGGRCQSTDKYGWQDARTRENTTKMLLTMCANGICPIFL